jgi:hypothetical protein
MSQNKEENPVESVGVGCGKKGLGPRSGGKVKGIIRRGKSYIQVMVKGGTLRHNGRIGAKKSAELIRVNLTGRY